MRNLVRGSVGLFSVVLSVALLGVALVGVGGSEAFGQPTSDTREFYVVHGLNLDGQTSQGDGGTNATVCVGDDELVPDLEFGEIVGPIDAPSESEFSALLYLQSTPGVPVDCGNPQGATALIDQTIQGLPSGPADPDNPNPANAMIAGGQDTPEFVVVNLGGFCFETGIEGNLVAVHAASAGPVNVSYAGTVNPGTRENRILDILLRTISVEVLLDGVVVAGPVEVFTRETSHNRSVVYVVGNRPGDPRSPFVALVQALPYGPQCPGFPFSPSDPGPVTQPTTASAVPVVATPAFTG